MTSKLYCIIYMSSVGPTAYTVFHTFSSAYPAPPRARCRSLCGSNSASDGTPKAVLSDKLRQFFPLGDASALSTESLTEAYSAGGKEGLLQHALDQAAAATEKKVHFFVTTILVVGVVSIFCVCVSSSTNVWTHQSGCSHHSVPGARPLSQTPHHAPISRVSGEEWHTNVAITNQTQLYQHLDHPPFPYGAPNKQLLDIEAVRAGLSSESARFLTLTQMDDLWCQHLENMNLLKESVSMEVFRGRNPLEEFGAQVSYGLRNFVLRNVVMLWLTQFLWGTDRLPCTE